MPKVDDLGTITNRISKRKTRNLPDVKFLKKMNVSSRDNCSIDNFVFSKGRSNDVESEDESEFNQDWKCETCNSDMVYIKKDAEKVCTNCGVSIPFQEMTKDEVIRQGYSQATTYLYKRQNHFKTWLKRTQGKETTFIDDGVIDQVRGELAKERITELVKINHVKIREILKKLRLNKYYNHCVQITSIITGKPPPQMSQEQEIALLQMFDSIQEPFQKIIQGELRQNMLSYSFLIHKFLEILSWDEFLPYFPLLVSADKIQYQDMIWQKICKEVNFEYIRSTM